MKKRLLPIAITAILLLSMAVCCYASYSDIEWTSYTEEYNTPALQFEYTPSIEESTIFKIRYSGDFYSVTDEYSCQVLVAVYEDGTRVLDYRSRYYDVVGGYVEVDLPIYDYKTGSTYLFVSSCVGYDEIYVAESYKYDVSGKYAEGYNAGVIKGQEDAEIVSASIEGFYNGMVSFLNFFMSLGIGALTIRNLCVIMIVTVIVMIIVKVVRG